MSDFGVGITVGESFNRLSEALRTSPKMVVDKGDARQVSIGRVRSEKI